MLDNAPYCRCCAGAAVEYLSHRFVRNFSPENTPSLLGTIQLGSKNAFAGAGTNTVLDTASAAAGDATANVTVAFTTPVQRLVLTYSNDITYTTNVLRQQTIGINSIAKRLSNR